MSLVGRTTQGINIQRTPWDDADAQNAAAQDQWRLAQMADARLRQGQSDARAMNQDNLNFGVWQSGQQKALSTQALLAQERIANMGFKSARDLQTEHHDFLGQQDVFRADRDDDRTTSERAYQDRLYGERVKPMQDRTLAEYDANAKERQRLRDEEAAYRAFMQGTPGSEGNVDYQGNVVQGTPGIKGFNQRLAGGEFTSEDDLIKAYMGGAGSRGESMLPQIVSGFRQDAQTAADRILADLESNDPRRRTRGLKAQETAPAQVKRLLGVTPQTAQDMGTIDAASMPQDVQTDLKGQVARTAAMANYNPGTFGDLGLISDDDRVQRTDSLREAVQQMIKSAPGLSATQAWDRVKKSLDTGGATWNIARLFGAIDAPHQDANEAAVETLDKEFGAF